jgi:hypothetical protein
MNHEQWIRSIKDGLTPTVAAQKAGLAHTTVLRQLAKGRLTADNVIAIAHAYNLKAGDALVKTGHITPLDLDGTGIETALGLATNKQLLKEIDKRIDPESVRIFHGEKEISPHIGNAVELDKTIQSNAPSPDDGWQYEEMAAADDSPDEPMPGDDGYHDGP